MKTRDERIWEYAANLTPNQLATRLVDAEDDAVAIRKLRGLPPHDPEAHPLGGGESTPGIGTMSQLPPAVPERNRGIYELNQRALRCWARRVDDHNRESYERTTSFAVIGEPEIRFRGGL